MCERGEVCVALETLEVGHIHAFFFGAQQTISGHGSLGLSFAENHSDIVIGTIRQALEISLRPAFGIAGR